MIHKTSDGFYVISSRKVWLPGRYDSKRSANYAFRFFDKELYELNQQHELITFEILQEKRRLRK